MGKPVEAKVHLEESLNFRTPDDERSEAFVYGQDIETTTRCIAAWSKFHEGNVDQALQLADTAAARAKKLQHANTSGYLHYHNGFMFVWMRHYDRVATSVDQLRNLTDQNELPLWKTCVDLLESAKLAIEGNYKEAVEIFEPALEIYTNSTRMTYLTANMVAQMGEAYISLNRYDHALEKIEQAFQIIKTTSENIHLPEVLRVQAKRLQHCQKDLEEADNAYKKALQTAQDMNTKWYELRIAIDYASYLISKNDKTTAISLLEPIYLSIDEGENFIDKITASKLLRSIQ